MLSSQFSLGPLTIHLYGLIIALAILLGWWLVKKRSARYKIDPALFDDLILILPFFLGIVGGRAYHVIDKWTIYASDPIKIFKVWEGGLGILGALTGIFIGFWLFAKIKKINLWALLDLVSPALILGQAIGRIGNFVNQEGFGPPTNLPWGVYIDQAHRPAQYLFSTHFHPTFFYEAILELIAFFILTVILGRSDRISKRFKSPGKIFGLYLVLFAASRSVAEIWRIDTAKVGDTKVAYLLCAATFLTGVYLLLRQKGLLTSQNRG